MADPATLLPGRWTVERTVRDGDVQGAFDGIAVFSPDGGGLAWDERGRLRWQRYDGPARRRLLVVPAGSVWEVRFEDGRLFHRLDLAAGASSAAHLCGADRYDGEYRIAGDDELWVRWRVRGPRKAQEIVSRYRRA